MGLGEADLSAFIDVWQTPRSGWKTARRREAGMDDARAKLERGVKNGRARRVWGLNSR
jgi:hypothetical protein